MPLQPQYCANRSSAGPLSPWAAWVLRLQGGGTSLHGGSTVEQMLTTPADAKTKKAASGGSRKNAGGPGAPPATKALSSALHPRHHPSQQLLAHVTAASGGGLGGSLRRFTAGSVADADGEPASGGSVLGWAASMGPSDEPAAGGQTGEQAGGFPEEEPSEPEQGREQL